MLMEHLLWTRMAVTNLHKIGIITIMQKHSGIYRKVTWYLILHHGRPLSKGPVTGISLSQCTSLKRCYMNKKPAQMSSKVFVIWPSWNRDMYEICVWYIHVNSHALSVCVPRSTYMCVYAMCTCVHVWYVDMSTQVVHVSVVCCTCYSNVCTYVMCTYVCTCCTCM